VVLGTITSDGPVSKSAKRDGAPDERLTYASLASRSVPA
jgi:hypothetical protein